MPEPQFSGSKPKPPSALQVLTGATETPSVQTEQPIPEPAEELAHEEGGHGYDMTGLAFVVIIALAAGLIMRRMKQPALVGYILAGIGLGPSGAQLVENRDSVQVLAEMGVLLLLFFVGMELSLRSFKRVWVIAVATTGFQIAAGLGAMVGAGYLLGWPMELAILLGFAIALSSTAVAIKMLEEIGELRTHAGQVAVGILIAQDLAVVPMMLIIDSLGGSGIGLAAVAKVVASVVVLIAYIVFLSRRERVRLPFTEVLEANPELLALSGLGICFGASALSGLAGLSPAYGAFLAGLLIGNSSLRVPMHHTIGPIQSVLLMVFFLSIGLLIDLTFLVDNIGPVLAILVPVTIAKTAMNVGFLRLMKQSWPNAAMAGLVLAQMGEFTFLLAALGLGRGIISPVDHQLLIAVTVLSLATSPFWFASARRLEPLTWNRSASGKQLVKQMYGSEAHVLLRSWDWVMVNILRRTLHPRKSPEPMVTMRPPRRLDPPDSSSEPGA